jgi:hypothetical protein
VRLDDPLAGLGELTLGTGEFVLRGAQLGPGVGHQALQLHRVHAVEAVHPLP